MQKKTNDTNKFSLASYTGHKNLFDSIGFSNLFEKSLDRYLFVGTAEALLKSYLERRRYEPARKESQCKIISFGMSQGSIISPFLF